MSNVTRTERAKIDLYEIWSYIEKDNPRAADALIDELTRKFELLAKHNGLGTPRPKIDANLRVFPVRRYLIVFRRITDGIEIVRVVHSARDLKKLKLQ
jgi:toxin ParE1/3/4